MIDLTNLSAAQKAALKAQLEAEEKQKKNVYRTSVRHIRAL